MHLKELVGGRTKGMICTESVIWIERQGRLHTVVRERRRPAYCMVTEYTQLKGHN
jgi:hypothetical protein